ncbi:LOW QUALITY PROTEIN: 39S ribosomal protein L12, mitochondrial-like [Microtus oregoni]|uniref:LOW QUALITY PROTEIN: 39S ribosomal protein L12, mitochondrial-like n=1 Tax=Microtus oregoni TaxID=111838 RepID=UPI001BB133D9|nr:LOW QUALITY PROTEIN: 39S ribosomal protein L12, mitochondrial-like [Microtus oregoni]
MDSRGTEYHPAVEKGRKGLSDTASPALLPGQDCVCAASRRLVRNIRRRPSLEQRASALMLGGLAARAARSARLLPARAPLPHRSACDLPACGAMLPGAAGRVWGSRLGLRGAALRLARQQVPSVCAARQLRSSSHRRSEALAGAPLDNAPKEYPPKIQQLVQDIASLTLLEISDLNELLKKTLKIQDVGLMPMGGMMPGAVPAAAAAAPEVAEAEDIPKQKERTHFTIRLTEAKPVDKVKLIKEIKNYVQGINLVQAKKLVESLPQEIKANVAKAEAEKIKAALEAVGGTVVLE